MSTLPEAIPTSQVVGLLPYLDVIKTARKSRYVVSWPSGAAMTKGELPVIFHKCLINHGGKIESMTLGEVATNAAGAEPVTNDVKFRRQTST